MVSNETQGCGLRYHLAYRRNPYSPDPISKNDIHIRPQEHGPSEAVFSLPPPRNRHCRGLVLLALDTEFAPRASTDKSRQSSGQDLHSEIVILQVLELIGFTTRVSYTSSESRIMALLWKGQTTLRILLTSNLGQIIISIALRASANTVIEEPRSHRTTVPHNYCVNRK